MRFLILFLPFVLVGCFSKYVMTEKELKEYYKDKTVKPTYFTIQNDSVKLFCATTGSDTLPPLLVIHGAPGAWYGSRNLLDDSILQQHYHMIAIDRLGYNKSRFKNKRKAVTNISIQTTAIHEALRLNRSHKKGIVMGSSYGAPIAAKMTLTYPDEFYQLVMLAPAIDPSKEKFWWFHKYIKHGPIKWMLPHFLRSATDEKFAHTAELKKLLPEWKNLSVPVTVVQGDADHIVDPANFDFAKKELAGKEAEFILLPGVDHLIRWQRPDVVREILLKHAIYSKEAGH